MNLMPEKENLERLNLNEEARIVLAIVLQKVALSFQKFLLSGRNIGTT